MSNQYRFQWFLRKHIGEIIKCEEHNFNPSQALVKEDLDQLFDKGKTDGCIVKNIKPEYLAGYLIYITDDESITTVRVWGENTEVLRMLVERVIKRLNKSRRFLKIVSYDDELDYHQVYRELGLKCTEVKYRDWCYDYRGGSIYSDSYVFEIEYSSDDKCPSIIA